MSYFSFEEKMQMGTKALNRKCLDNLANGSSIRTLKHILSTCFIE